MRLHEEVESHVRRFFEGHAISKSAWLPGPAAKLRPDLYSLAIAPGPLYSGWVYFTVGASEVASPRLEFFVCCPYATGVAIELLAMVAHYHSGRASGCQS